MIAALLFLQASLLVSPVYRTPEPPEGRALREILVIHAETPAVSRTVKRTREEAQARAESLRAQLLEGADFADLARTQSEHPSARYGGIRGTAWPGMLGPELDAFLFNAELGAISPVIESPMGFHVLQRIERDTAWRHIKVDGSDEAAQARTLELLKRLNAGEDFAELARECSSDRASAERGGVVGILQRGPRDALLKAAAFEAKVGQIVGPIPAPGAYYLLQRIDPAGVDPSLREQVTIRVRAILISFTAAKGASPQLARTSQEAEVIALDLAERIRSGEEMSELAARFDENPGGAEHCGDLGWIMRQASDIPSFMERAFSSAVGELVGPIATNAGWVLFRRER